MTLIILLVAMTAVATALLVWPLLREEHAVERSAFDLQVYEDQLRELERDLAGRLIDQDQAEAARTEIKRRILATSERGRNLTDGSGTGPRSVITPVALAFSIPVLCSTVYLAFGAPELPSSPFAGRRVQTAQSTVPVATGGTTFQPTAEQRAAIEALSPAERDQRINAMVDGLEQRLKTSTPDDLDGWMMLGRSRMVLGDRAAAAAAYRRVLTLLGPGDPRRRDVELTLAAVDGQVDPASPAPVADAVGSTMVQPTAEQRAALQALPTNQRNERIAAMVDGLSSRLEENPEDVAGWLMLARSRMVLGEPDQARDAYRQALTLLEPDDPRWAEIKSSLGQLEADQEAEN